MRYQIEIDPEAEAELAALRPYDQVVILDAIETSLRHEPTRISRNRKLVVPSKLSEEIGFTWELRIGAFRVFYDVLPPKLVVVIRIVRKGSQTMEGSLT